MISNIQREKPWRPKGSTKVDRVLSNCDNVVPMRLFPVEHSSSFYLPARGDRMRLNDEPSNCDGANCAFTHAGGKVGGTLTGLDEDIFPKQFGAAASTGFQDRRHTSAQHLAQRLPAKAIIRMTTPSPDAAGQCTAAYPTFPGSPTPSPSSAAINAKRPREIYRGYFVTNYSPLGAQCFQPACSAGRRFGKPRCASPRPAAWKDCAPRAEQLRYFFVAEIRAVR